MFTIPTTEEFHKRVKKESKYYNQTMTQFITQAINEKLERRPPSLAEESQNKI